MPRFRKKLEARHFLYYPFGRILGHMKGDVRNRMDRLEEFIRKSSEIITSDSVPDNAFYSYRHANRLFKSLKGESINSYSNKIRLQASAEYLKYSAKSISDIAFEVGYQSVAAFSKAFKKQYGMSPSLFREKNNLLQKLEDGDEAYYKIRYIDKMKVRVRKLTLKPEFVYEEFYQQSKEAFLCLGQEAKQWLLLWDEDPELSMVAESRYYAGLEQNGFDRQASSAPIMFISGLYAIFEAKHLKQFGYKLWAQLACELLALDGKQLREGFCLEWFTPASLASFDAFAPDQFAIPIA
ncbi:MAG: helix-turn-helix transcriptional regulator [Bacteroidota bacterium]